MSTKNLLPWQIHPSLKPERLEFLAALFRDVRHDLSLLHEPSRGDTNWSRGCRAYDRTRYAVAQAAIGEQRDWLSIVEDDGLHFVFSIGAVPIRFYRGEPNKSAVSRRARQESPEAQALLFALHSVEEPGFDELVPRLVIETDALGEVSNVVMVWLDENGVPRYPYSVPLTSSSKITPIRSREEARDLPKPPLGSDRKNEEEEDG